MLPDTPFGRGGPAIMDRPVLLLVTMLIKAKVSITAFSAPGLFLLLLQTLVFLTVSGGALYATQQRRPKAA